MISAGRFDLLDDLGHGEGLARAGDAQQHLMLLAVSDTTGQRLDRVALIALGLVGTDETKFHDYSAQQERSRSVHGPYRTQFQRVGIS